MSLTTKIPTLPSFNCSCSNTISNKLNNPTQKSSLSTLKPLNFSNFSVKISNLGQKPISKFTSFCHLYPYPDEIQGISPISSSGVVSSRLSRLVTEFRSLPEPIDRVKRLLDYAAVLPRLGESTRSPENRVPGCAAQVWLEVVVDEVGRMRFGADSDSEITKGFCSCLIFLLDGAFPEDVLKVKAEDLADMNVGLPVRSRVNSWNNVLMSIQERTKCFLVEKDQEACQLDSLNTFLPLVVPADSVVAKGNHFCNSCH
ncbi:sufE-like protein 2, chloroplastic isoform X1 [Chenopodium quinoa]|uniref:sufE-like protein 2, chloroplastic isoform X1 n=1 Tax=Chenopodium quinoa TaxID=63459 RepID=UPI000B77F4EA|nr:sufE-like protein 2, chloroplastic isoform X1 [Chenopodium quinoa]